MKYILGIDGGGTKTHCCLTDTEGNILNEVKGNASNFLVIGIDEAVKNLFALIEDCRKKIGINYSDIEIILLGTTGAGRRPDAEKLERAMIDFLHLNKISFNNFFVESDARIALEGAFSGKPGCILISGTGSIIFGKNSNNEIFRAGGFGRYIGDEGSGYSIGKKGLTAAAKEFDGRGESTLITKLVSEKFNIKTSEILITEVYRHNFDIASAAPLIIEAAEKNDIAALKILDEETDELILHILAIKEKINDSPLNISFMGGLLNNENFFSKLLRKKIQDKVKNVLLKAPENNPAFGAAILAKKLIKNG